jgi:hypothetical protein
MIDLIPSIKKFWIILLKKSEKWSYKSNLFIWYKKWKKIYIILELRLLS